MSTKTARRLEDTVTLNNFSKMPLLGLGVYKTAQGNEIVNAVRTAFEAGYRSIDTAAIYGNEEGVGQAIAEAIAQQELKREHLFITSKIWNSEQGYKTTHQAFTDSLQRLKLDYLDLYLIHWPVIGKYKETWSALEELYLAGKIRAIGISNFQVHHMKDLLSDAKIIPAVNQIELHPYLTQKEIRSYAAKQKIQIESWSPLGQGQLLKDPTIIQLANKYKKTAAQVILRWHLQHDLVTIPKSANRNRIIENTQLYDFSISDEDMCQIDHLDCDKRVGPHPDTFDF